MRIMGLGGRTRSSRSRAWRALAIFAGALMLPGSAWALPGPTPSTSSATNVAAQDAPGSLAEPAAAGDPIDAVLALWRCNIPECNSPDWTGAVITWPDWAAHHSNARSGDQSRAVFAEESGEPLFPYMGSWADGCEVTAVSGTVLIIEWQRGTDDWRETLLEAGETHVIDLVTPEDGAMIEGENASPGFSVSLQNCDPQPILQADLAVSMTDGETTATPGTPVTYTITVAYAGPGVLSELTLVDTLPPALMAPVFTPASGSYNPGTGAWTGIQLAPGGSTTMTLTGTIDPAAIGTLVNSVTVAPVPAGSDPDASNNSASDTDTLVPSADLAIAKTGPATVIAGQTVTYVITVTNGGPSRATAVSVNDVTPVGLTFLSNDCLNAFPCNLGGLTVGQTRTITSTYRIGAAYPGPTLANTATVAAATSDPVGSNDTSTALSTVSRSADLAITKTGPGVVTPGQNVTYTIIVTNLGPSSAAGVSVDDPTPAGLAFASNDCGPSFPCSLGGMAVGQTRTITTTFTVGAGYPGTTLANTAAVAAATSDPVNTNDTATALSTVNLSADLAIAKSGPGAVAPGQSVTYTIVVTNLGPSLAAGVSVNDPTPAGLAFVSTDCGPSFPCSLGAMAAGETRTITTTFTVGAGYTATTVANLATVSATTPDPASGNNSWTASSAVTSPADLTITKTGPTTVTRGGELTYTITVTNDGPTAAADVQVNNTPPPGLTFVSNDGHCTTRFPCALGLLAAGATRTITATFSVPADYSGPNPIQNVTSVSSATADPDPSDNSATASTSLVGLAFHTLAPCRVLDTRESANGPALAPGPARSFAIAGLCGVPSTAQAASVNVTVTQPTDPGDLRIYPGGSEPPLASAINYAAGQTRANNAVVKLGPGGGLEVLCDQAVGTVHFVLDVNGYFE